MMGGPKYKYVFERLTSKVKQEEEERSNSARTGNRKCLKRQNEKMEQQIRQTGSHLNAFSITFA